MLTDAQQINGREGETATFLKTSLVKFHVAWRRFRPTSSQPLGCFLIRYKII
jgi:hypothetical protein